MRKIMFILPRTDEYAVTFGYAGKLRDLVLLSRFLPFSLSLILLVILVCGCSKGGQKGKMRDLYEEGEELYEQMKYKDAIARFKAVAMADENSDGLNFAPDFRNLTRYKLALCYFKLAEGREDLNLYNESLRYTALVSQNATRDEYREKGTFLWGRILFNTERYEEAEAKFAALTQEYLDGLLIEEALYYIAHINYRLSKYGAARQTFASILASSLSTAHKDDAQRMIAQSFLREGNYEGALEAFEKLGAEEYQPEALYKVAYSFSKLERHEEALATYDELVKNYPDSHFATAAYFDMGTIYGLLKDYKNARRSYYNAFDTTADSGIQAEIQYEIGRSFYEESDYQNALESHQKLIKIYPENRKVADAKIQLAGSYLYLKDYRKSLDICREILKQYPEDSRINYYKLIGFADITLKELKDKPDNKSRKTVKTAIWVGRKAREQMNRRAGE